MKQSKNLVAAIKGLVDELKVSFPLDNQEAQRVLTVALQEPNVIRIIRSTCGLTLMEDTVNE
jgi:hypothetical protein